MIISISSVRPRNEDSPTGLGGEGRGMADRTSMLSMSSWFAVSLMLCEGSMPSSWLSRRRNSPKARSASAVGPNGAGGHQQLDQRFLEGMAETTPPGRRSRRDGDRAQSAPPPTYAAPGATVAPSNVSASTNRSSPRSTKG